MSTTSPEALPRPGGGPDYHFDFGHGGLGWDPIHGWLEGRTPWVDGRITGPGAPRGQYLDMATLGCSDLVDLDDDTVAPRALAAWADGAVLVIRPYPRLAHVSALVIPETALTTEWIEAALRRFRP